MQYPLTQNKLYFALNCATMIDIFSSIFYQNSKPLVFLPNVYAYIWRCDHPIEMGFSPKDAKFSCGVQRKNPIDFGPENW